jgi:signal-transduction protein with cAMP-binding, CBS, and nucleotidyltransferase domain
LGLSLLQLKKFEKTFDNKTVIFKEGGEGTTLYIMVKGSVSVLKGIKKVAEISEPGTWFGEMAPLLGEPRTATILTNEVSTFMVIPSQALGTLVNDMGMKLATVLASRIQNTTNQLVAAQDEKKDLDNKCRTEYQKLVKIIGCASLQSKLPQMKSLHEYAKKSSFLATGGYPPQLDELHMDDFLKKAVQSNKHKV